MSHRIPYLVAFLGKLFSELLLLELTLLWHQPGGTERDCCCTAPALLSLGARHAPTRPGAPRRRRRRLPPPRVETDALGPPATQRTEEPRCGGQRPQAARNEAGVDGPRSCSEAHRRRRVRGLDAAPGNEGGRTRLSGSAASTVGLPWAIGQSRDAARPARSELVPKAHPAADSRRTPTLASPPPPILGSTSISSHWRGVAIFSSLAALESSCAKRKQKDTEGVSSKRVFVKKVAC